PRSGARFGTRSARSSGATPGGAARGRVPRRNVRGRCRRAGTPPARCPPPPPGSPTSGAPPCKRRPAASTRGRRTRRRDPPRAAPGAFPRSHLSPTPPRRARLHRYHDARSRGGRSGRRRAWRRPPVLELVDVSRRFRDVVALDGVSFSAPPGRMVGFVGPNGAGKTTAMRIVLGVLEPDRGVVLWRGRPVDADARRRFGYMPEERGLYPKMRVLDQLVYLGRLHGLDDSEAAASARRSIEVLGVADRARDPVQQLSLGNQQRVQLAAALVHAPELLVLDEPFSGLDPTGVDVLSGVLREQVAAGVPVVFSSHQLDLVERICDSVVLIAHGRIVAAGSIDELRSRGDRRLVRVELSDASPGWEEVVAGARVLERSPVGAVFELEPGTPPDAVLDAAWASGTVRTFSVVRPSLTEIFREAVAG